MRLGRPGCWPAGSQPKIKGMEYHGGTNNFIPQIKSQKNFGLNLQFARISQQATSTLDLSLKTLIIIICKHEHIFHYKISLSICDHLLVVTSHLLTNINSISLQSSHPRHPQKRCIWKRDVISRKTFTERLRPQRDINFLQRLQSSFRDQWNCGYWSQMAWLEELRDFEPRALISIVVVQRRMERQVLRSLFTWLSESC